MERPHLLLALAAVLSWAMCAPAQSTSAPNAPAPATPQGDQKQQSRPAPPPAQQFPYPGETPPAPDPRSTSVPQAPSGSAPVAPGSGSAFPYPGDPEAGGSASSSSSSSSSSSGSADDSTPELPKDTAPTRRRKLPKQFHPQSPEDRATEDIAVARFYQDKGDLQAAYLRAEDAVKQLPRDPEAHLVLGQIAQKMKRRDEARTELNTYLRLEPDGDHVREARRSLAQLR